MFTLLRNNISQQILFDGSHPAPLCSLYSEEGLEGRSCFFQVIFESMKSVSLNPPVWFSARIRISDVNTKREESWRSRIILGKETVQRKAVTGAVWGKITVTKSWWSGVIVWSWLRKSIGERHRDELDWESMRWQDQDKLCKRENGSRWVMRN